MKPDDRADSGVVAIPGVVSLAASSRRTLKHGDSFAMFDEAGDITEVERSPAGLFHHDTRYLSRLQFTLEGHRPLVLSSTVQPDNIVLDVDLTNPDLFEAERLVLAKDTFHVARAKFLRDGSCHELFTVTSYADEPRRMRLALEFAADFADLFEIRGFPRTRRGRIAVEARGPAQTAFVYQGLDGLRRETRLCFSPAPARLSAGRADFEIELRARERRTIGVTVQCLQGDADAPAAGGYFSVLRRARRSLVARRSAGATLTTSNATCNAVLERSRADLEMLTTETPQGPYPYAGVPWFSTAFGRDGILTAMQTLWLDPSIARGVLRFLAANQATVEDPSADMEPGKILHEVRDCELARLGEVPFRKYYGAIDSTPLFIALAGLYWQRTRDRATIDALWPAVKAGLAWIERYGDRDDDGFVEYGRMRETGLRNQGWKDSDDAVFHAEGPLALAPVALCEVQGYVYLAKQQAALLAADLGEREFAASLDEQADVLRTQFEHRFWVEELGTYALALDGDKQPCRVRSSNAGQLLFTGIATPEHALRVARGLFAPDFFTGWGVRTLSSREKRFNPTSYHNGSVWPHDNALIALGLAHYRLMDQALSLTAAIFDAAAHMHLRRLPELFCGFERRRGKAPTPYPVACAPQAWAAAAPLALLQACLGLEVDCAASKVTLREPRLPPFLDWLEVRRLAVGDSLVDLLFRRHGSSVSVNLLGRRGDVEIEVML